MHSFVIAEDVPTVHILSQSYVGQTAEEKMHGRGMLISHRPPNCMNDNGLKR